MLKYDQFVKSASKKFRHVKEAQKDIVAALSFYPSLSPILNNSSGDGKLKQILQLSGTVPVNYVGCNYNIPITILLNDMHPYSAPRVKVCPTSEMQLVQSAAVNAQGFVFLSYLSQWKYPKSDLCGLLAILQVTFGESPPVRAIISHPTQQPYSMSPCNDNLYSATDGTLQYGGPQAIGSGWSNMSNNNSNFTTQGLSFPMTQPLPPITATANSARVLQRRETVTDEELMLSMRSALEDEMRNKLGQIAAMFSVEWDSLTQKQDVLSQRQAMLKSLIVKAEYDENNCRNMLTTLRQHQSATDNRLSQMTATNLITVDEYVDVALPLYKQLFSCYAEEQATEDAIFFLGEALTKSVINLDIYLKKVRELSRKQFILREIVRTCLRKAELPD